MENKYQLDIQDKIYDRLKVTNGGTVSLATAAPTMERIAAIDAENIETGTTFSGNSNC
tara:strand:- start:422 stop:595 length:174 start_codon:yes stop_codon:yes gene_type:complete